MFDKLTSFLVDLVIGGVVLLWDKVKAWRHPGAKPEAPRHVPESKPLIISQGVAASFIVSEPSTLPGAKEYEEILRAAIFYPQTRAGAEAFLGAMAEERKGTWVSTSVSGVAEDDEGRAAREEAIKLIRPLEKVDLYSKAEDSDDEYDCDSESGMSEGDRNWISVSFIGDRLGFLEPQLAAEIVKAKEEESTRMLAVVLEITGTSERDRGIDIGILRWDAKLEKPDGELDVS